MQRRSMRNNQAVSNKQPEKIIVELTMPLEEARQVIWTAGYGPQEPMGKLFNEGFLDAKQLRYGMTNAYDPRVKEAARTLLAHLLNQSETIEATRRFGPKVIKGSRYLQ